MTSEVTLKVILLTWLTLAGAEYSIDDALLFKINFNSFSTSKIKDDLQTTLGGDPDPVPAGLDPTTSDTAEAPSFDENAYLETVIMKSTNSEEYACKIPRLKNLDGSDGQGPYEGPNVLELLKQVFVSQSCAYRLEHYWTYELCHGKHIRQYHEERDGTKIKQTEYFLGKYDSESFDKDVAYLKEQLEAGTAKKPQKMRIETMNMPYYQIVMKDGTICDLNGQPRITRVNYVCYPAGKNEMYSFKESSTCEYDIIVLSPTLCQHPDYRPEESNELGIECTPTNEKSPYKPRNLIQLETESLKLRSEKMFEGEFMQGDKPGSVRIEIKPVSPTAALDNTDIIDDEDTEIDAAVQNKESNWPQKPPREEFKPIMDPEVVKQFLLGEYCLYGGAGWWKYEFCYGKKVNQYHEEKNGQRTVINLGLFDSQKHLDWLAINPQKRPKSIELRKHVSHLYSGGDICDITGKPRTVEVKLKCKKSDSISSVSLYLLEPKTCEYVLGVESPLVCDIIHLADENGFMSLNKADFAADEPKIEPELAEEEPPESPAVNLPSYKGPTPDSKSEERSPQGGGEPPLSNKFIGDNVRVDWELADEDDDDFEEGDEQQEKNKKKDKDEL